MQCVEYKQIYHPWKISIGINLLQTIRWSVNKSLFASAWLSGRGDEYALHYKSKNPSARTYFITKKSRFKTFKGNPLHFNAWKMVIRWPYVKLLEHPDH